MSSSSPAARTRPSLHRVLVVDDRAEVRMLLRVCIDLEHDMEVVGEAADGHEAVRLAALLSPSAVVLDLEMPVMNGDEAIPLLRAAVPGMRILLYTASPPFEVADGWAPDATVAKSAPIEDVVIQLRDLVESGIDVR